MAWLIVVVLALIFVGSGSWLLIRAANRLIEFDQLLEGVLDVLTEYHHDLKKLSSGSILLDHPEVAKFHNRNLTAVREIEALIERIGSTRPEREPQPQLPRPDVED